MLPEEIKSQIQHAIQHGIKEALAPWLELERAFNVPRHGGAIPQNAEPHVRLRSVIWHLERLPARQLESLVKALTKFAPEEMETIKARYNEQRRGLDTLMDEIAKQDEIPF